MKKFLSLAILGASVAAAPLAALATPIVSSVSFSLNNVKINGGSGSTFDNSNNYINTISWAGSGSGSHALPPASDSADGTGYFSGVVLGGDLLTGSSTTLTLGSSSFTLNVLDDSDNVVGVFTGTQAPFVFSNTNSGGSSLTAYLNGSFTFQGSLASYGTQSALITFSFTQTGSSLSGSGTLATPGQFTLPPTVPEPSSLILLGTGLVGGVGAVRRRFKA